MPVVSRPLLQCSSSLNRFTVLSYNILSPSYMWPQVYTYVDDQYKDWSYRHKLLSKEILEDYKSDVVCLQELTLRDYNEFWSHQFESMNYDAKFIVKTPPAYWERSIDEMDGVGIFVNKKKFETLSTTGFYLNQLMAGTFSKVELEFLKRKQLEITDGNNKYVKTSNLLDFVRAKNQVCLMVLTRHISSGTYVIFINTHLYWKYDEVKLTQCLIIMRELQKIIRNQIKLMGSTLRSDKFKVVFVGDLNSPLDSLVINFLRGEILSHDNALNLVNPMKPYLNKCVYDCLEETDPIDRTCYSGKLQGIFDYIWFHDKDFQLTNYLGSEVVDQELSAADEMGLPNSKHPSDHIPIQIELELL